MKKVSVIFGALMSITQIILAQDIIFKKNGEVIEGKVLEISETSIKYNKKENPNGPMYSINKSDVLKIKYENGKVDTYESATTSTTSLIDDEEVRKLKFDSLIRLNKNIIGWDILQFVYVSAGVSYERFFGKNSQFSIRIPFSVGFYYIGNEDNLIINDSKSGYYYSNADYYIYQRGKIAGGALEFNYYPLGLKKFSYFVGPYFEYGVFAYKIRKYYPVYDPYGYLLRYDYTVTPLRYNGQHIAGGINNGFIYHINEIFTITGTFGLGLKKDETPIAGDKILTQAKFNFIFGIKF